MAGALWARAQPTGRSNPATILKGDFEYQHKTERDGSGYQLLGGTTLPDINRIYRSTMLGDQPWGPADTYDTFNTGARLEHTFSPSWVAFAAASFSHSLIQDNVIYAYGCYYETECAQNPGPAPRHRHTSSAPDGTYDIYDYRDPGELRIDAEAEAMLTGHIHTGAVTQDITAGGEVFLRSVQQPGFYTAQNPYDPSGIVQDGAVYTYVGSENIYQPIAPIRSGAPLSRDPLESAGPRRLWEDSHQSAGSHPGSHPSSRPHSAHRRRPLRFSARPQLFRLRQSCASALCRSCNAAHRHPTDPTPSPDRQARLAAAIRHHLQPRRRTSRSTRTTA